MAGRPVTSRWGMCSGREGSTDAVSCPGLESESGVTIGCSGAEVCVSKYVWKQINDAITQTVDTIFLSTLVEESRRAKEQHPGVEPSCEVSA